MKLQTEILSQYNNLDSRVVKAIEKIVATLEEQNIEVTEYTKIILNMLVTQWILYYKASDDIAGTNKVSSTDSYDRKAKMPEISIMQKANDQILNLMDKIAIAPLSKAKIKKLNEKLDKTNESAIDLLTQLTN